MLSGDAVGALVDCWMLLELAGEESLVQCHRQW